MVCLTKNPLLFFPFYAFKNTRNLWQQGLSDFDGVGFGVSFSDKGRFMWQTCFFTVIWIGLIEIK